MDLTSLRADFAQLTSRVRRNSATLEHDIAVLSSGSRLIRAGDDVAALSIGTRLATRVATLKSIQVGVAQATSLLQVADGGLKQIQDVLERMQSLSVMALSGALSKQERQYLDLEFHQLKMEIDRLANRTNFNNVPLLNRKSVLAPIVVDAAIPPSNTITGTVNNDAITGTDGGDDITALYGDDAINAGAGDDVIHSGGFMAGLQGSVFVSGAGIANLAQAQAIAAGAASATFNVTTLDYPNGAVTSQTSTLGAFLGVDAASLSNPALNALTANQMVFTFEGYIQVDMAGTYSFSVGSDDGFQIDIDGAIVSQFTANRGYGVTTGNATLSAGIHSFRLIYWENTGGEGVFNTSSLVAGAALGGSVLRFGTGPIDGDDVIDGDAGNDIAVFDGNRSDYIITQLDADSFQIIDNRTGSPGGTDVLHRVEMAGFADMDMTLYTPSPDSPGSGSQLVRPYLSFVVSDVDPYEMFVDILPVTLDELFTDPEHLNITDTISATAAQVEIRSAIDILTSRRAYVGSKQAQTDIIADSVVDRLQNQDIARAQYEDADFVKASTDFAQDIVKNQMSITMHAQASQINTSVLLRLFNGSGGGSGIVGDGGGGVAESTAVT